MSSKHQNSNSLLLSICVPTYNRSELLKEMLDSVNCLYLDKIEIVIVDDGSKDSTKKLCKEYKKKYNLNYIYQENKGRSFALRTSILNTSGLYAVIMDSYDKFVSNGLNLIIKSIIDLSKQIHENNFAGMVFLCCDEKQNILGKGYLQEKSVGNIIRDYADLKINGDKKEVILLDILKKYMYEPFESEKRMATSILWNRISQKYDVININQIVALKIYCDDGLGKNIDKVRMLSSKSSSLFYSESLNSHRVVYFSYIYALRMFINLIRYSMHSKTLEFLKKVNFKLSNLVLLFPALPVGFFLYLRDKVKTKP